MNCTNDSPPNEGGGRSRSAPPDDSDRQARNAIIHRYNDKIAEAEAAAKAGNYREAARLRREALQVHEPLGESEASRVTRSWAEFFERYADALDASKAGYAAAEAGNYAQALQYYRTMVLNPAFDSEHNRNVIADIKARLQAEQDRIAQEAQAEQDRIAQEAQAERNRIAQEAENVKVAAKIREQISKFASSLDTAPPKAGWVVTQGGTLADHMGTHKAEAPLQFGDPNALEALSEQARQGFDKAGPLKGSKPVASVDPASHNPEMIAAENELTRLKSERDRMEADISKLTRERNAEKNPVRMQELTAALDEKNRAKQEKLVQIAETTKKNGKLRRCINTEVEKAAAEKPKGSASGGKPCG